MMPQRCALASAIAVLAISHAAVVHAQSAEETAVKNAVRAETDAYYARNADAWQGTWVQDSTAMRTGVGNGQFEVDAGWEKFGPATVKAIKQAGTPLPIHLETSNYRIQLADGLAWVEYDQRITTPTDSVPYVSREQRALVRKSGQWKIMSALTEDLAAFGSSPRAIEARLNGTGYALLSAKKVTDAIEVLKLNTQLFPNSFNAYDSLGEAYAAAGNRELAVKSYEKSIALNPKSESGKVGLAKLRGAKTP